MNISNFIYRQKQKFRYHTAKDDLYRLIAEINRNDKLVEVGKATFKLKGFDFHFPNNYLFLLNRHSDLIGLLQHSNGAFDLYKNQLIYKFQNLKFFIKTAEELFILKEVFIQEIYKLLVGATINVIDVGMNVGFTSLYFANRSDIKKVFSYEPFPVTFKEAQENFQLNKDIQHKIESRNFGLGVGDEKIQVRFSAELKGKNTTSVEKKNDSIDEDLTEIDIAHAGNEIERITSTAGNELFAVKLDCEGAEFDIFRSFGDQPIAGNIVAFMIEWHRVYPKEIIDKLLANNFKVHCTSNSEKIGFIIAIR